MTDLTEPVPPPRTKKPRGCLFYGCITAVALFLLVGVGGYFAVRYGLQKLVASVEPYTDATPMQLPESTMGDSDYGELEQRVAAFAAATPAAAGTPPLVLTSDDINTLIDRHPAWQALRGRLHVSLQGDVIEAKVALPLDMLDNLPWLSELKGRYVNATVAMHASFDDETLVTSLRSVQVKGEDLPPDLLQALKGQRIERFTEPQAQDLRRRIESFRVEGGLLTIRAKTAK